MQHAKSWLIGKDSDAGRDWGQEEKGTTEDEMAGWHHWLNGRESEWTLRVGDGQGGLVCCDSWGRNESDTTEQLIWSDLIWTILNIQNEYWILNKKVSQVTLVVKNLLPMQEIRIQSLSQEDPQRRKWQPTLVFLLGKSMDRGAWWAIVHRVTKSRIQLRLLSTYVQNTNGLNA